MASDGSLSKDKRHLNFTSNDTELLEIIIELLELRTSIKSKSNSYGGVGYYVQFGDVALYDFLYNAGIRPAKSLSIKQVLVPDAFYCDFLRGYFDDDGTIYGFWVIRWVNSLMYYTEYSSASLDFIDWLHSQNIRLAFVKKGRIKPGARALSLSYAKADSRNLFEFMYYDTAKPKLKRKYDKFIAFLELDPYSIKDFARVA